jgi:hypothetical protein
MMWAIIWSLAGALSVLIFQWERRKQKAETEAEAEKERRRGPFKHDKLLENPEIQRAFAEAAQRSRRDD